MTKIALGFATAALVSLSSFSAPAYALPAHPLATSDSSDVVNVRLVRHKVCTVRTVVTRGFHGKRIVKRVKVCR